MAWSVIDILPMVGQIDQDGILIPELIDDHTDDLIIIQRGIVIVGHGLTLCLVEILTGDVCGLEASETCRIALVSIRVLPHQMDDVQRLGRLKELITVLPDELTIILID
jgi:hypothetical protein